MTARDDLPTEINTALRRPLFLTRLGMGSEVIVRAFWPFWSVLFAGLAFLMLGLQDHLPAEAVWSFLALAAVSTVWALVRGVRRFYVPTEASATQAPSATGDGSVIITASSANAAYAFALVDIDSWTSP